MSTRLFGTIGALMLLASLPAVAAPDAPVHLVVTKPLTRVTDALASISRQSGTPILADDTVVDTLGVTTVDKPSVEAMLDFVKTLAPALTWQRVYLPQATPLPDAGALSSQVRALKAITGTGLIVADPAAHSTVAFKTSTKTSTDTPAAPPEGMKVVYLVTNETVRAQREANKKAAEEKKAAPVNQAVANVNSAADAFARMNADEQRQAIPQLFQQFGRMFQSLDPAVRQEMGQQFRQWRQQRQGNGGQ